MIWLIVWILLAIILAAVVGFIFGWWIRAKICARAVADREARIAQLKLERDNAAANRPSQSGPVAVPKPAREAATNTSKGPSREEADGADRVEAAPTAAPATPIKLESPDEDRPAGLKGPRDGQPDELRKISGVGPKLERTLHELGVFHFDQIAAWTDDNIAWVDGYLKFRGRINRENWIEQAKVLASGGETEFSRRYSG